METGVEEFRYIAVDNFFVKVFSFQFITSLALPAVSTLSLYQSSSACSFISQNKLRAHHHGEPKSFAHGAMPLYSTRIYFTSRVRWQY
jgi:hypothetical protein